MSVSISDPTSALLSPNAPSTLQSTLIDFPSTPLAKDYSSHYASIIDTFLSLSECTQLLSLAASSTTPHDSWTPATIKSGPNTQSIFTDSRSCSRVFYQAPSSLADAMLARLRIAVPEIVDLKPGSYPHAVGNFKGGKSGWRMDRLDPNFRFLRYGPGEYFKEHCDAMFVDKEKEERSFFTVHLYLNGGEEDEVVEGGATTFHSMSLKEKLDVDPTMGMALVFQQRGLLHSGAEVVKGVKYSMRTDVIYKKVQ